MDPRRGSQRGSIGGVARDSIFSNDNRDRRDECILDSGGDMREDRNTREFSLRHYKLSV